MLGPAATACVEHRPVLTTVNSTSYFTFTIIIHFKLDIFNRREASESLNLLRSPGWHLIISKEDIEKLILYKGIVHLNTRTNVTRLNIVSQGVVFLKLKDTLT